MNKLVYLDNAATSFPKPPEVLEEIQRVILKKGGNPGRGGHFLSRKADEEVYNCRKELKAFFNARSEEDIVFTKNATEAINISINGLLNGKNRVITTDFEHNSVIRPLRRIKNLEVTPVTVSLASNEETLENFKAATIRKVDFFVVSHASNVLGKAIPIKEVCEIAHSQGAEVILDASQSAGILDIDLQRDGIDYLCAPGHKGLYGPQGSGFLIINGKRIPSPLVFGGTGSATFSRQQPDFLPDMLESGTLNTPAIGGLSCGIRFLKREGREGLHKREISMIRKAYRALEAIPKVKLYTPIPSSEDAPVLCFNVDKTPSFKVSGLLDEYGICTRAGYHCAPDAHEKIGTKDIGGVRISVGAFNTVSEIEFFAEILEKISK